MDVLFAARVIAYSGAHQPVIVHTDATFGAVGPVGSVRPGRFIRLLVLLPSRVRTPIHTNAPFWLLGPVGVTPGCVVWLLVLFCTRVRTGQL